MRCPDCFNPTGNAAVSSVTVCARVHAHVCVLACVRVGVEKYEVGYARGTLEI